MKVAPHPRRITRVIAVGLIAGAVAAPAASAKPAPLETVQRGHQILLEPQPAPVVRTVDTGFDWDSAAIGAGGAGALRLVFAAGGVAYRSRHGNHIGLSG
jgi:hypothetical protein